MSTEPLPPSDESTPDSGAEGSAEGFKTLRSVQNLHEPDLDFDPLDALDDDLDDDVVQEGQPPMADGEEAPHRFDDSTLPKATMPVELAPKPESPAAPASEPAQVADTAAPSEVPAEKVSVESAPPVANTPRSLGGWVSSLSMVEKLCCILIIAGILLFGITVFVPGLYDFSDESGMTEVGDFPIKGQYVEVHSASTHWRKPVLEGPDADTIRAGTVYVPEMILKLNGKASIRILFRNSEGSLVGDPVALELDGERDVFAASTVGLNEAGDFSAQRTGEAELWSVELHEAASGAGEVADYALLYKMKISPIEK